MQVWRNPALSEVTSLLQPSPPNCVSFDPAGRLVGVGCWDGAVRVWDWERRQNHVVRKMTTSEHSSARWSLLLISHIQKQCFTYILSLFLHLYSSFSVSLFLRPSQVISPPCSVCCFLPPLPLCCVQVVRMGKSGCGLFLQCPVYGTVRLTAALLQRSVFCRMERHR